MASAFDAVATRRIPMRARAAVLLAALFFSAPTATAIAEQVTAIDAAEFEHRVDETVRAVRQETGVIALAAGVVTRDGLVVEVAQGERRRGSGEPVEVGDRWHVASCSKAMTALLYGRLVEQGVARWGATLPELFPEWADDMHPHWRSIRVEDLLSHRAGLGDVGALWWIGGRISRLPPAAQRRRTVERLLHRPPTHQGGTFHYSNFGYMTVGAAIERLVARAEDAPPGLVADWEALLASEVWSRLEVPGGLGLGPPQGEEPEGHMPRWLRGLQPVGQGRAADNPRAFGPAGIVHTDFASWASFLAAMLPGPSPFATDLRERITTPYPNADADAESGYALGWFVEHHAELGVVWNHPGSNRMWRALQTVVPERGFAIAVATNQADEAGVQAADRLTERLLELAGAGLPLKSGSSAGER